MPVLSAQGYGRRCGGLELGGDAAVEQDEETEAGVAQGLALPCPGVRLGAGRRVEPVTGEGEVAAELGQAVVAGIEVAVKAGKLLGGQMYLPGGRGRSLRGQWVTGPAATTQGGQQESEEKPVCVHRISGHGMVERRTWLRVAAGIVLRLDA